MGHFIRNNSKQNNIDKENVAGESSSEVQAENLTTFYGFVKFIGPIAILALIWGQRGLLAKFILQLNNTYLSTLCPSYSRRERLLQWTRTRLPVPLGSRPGNFTNVLWKNGYFMCALINSAVPGACSNPHRHWGKPPSHAQALAYKYLGIPPIFTHEDFENKSAATEKRLLQYIHLLQQAIARLPVQYDIDNMPLKVKWTSQFTARGMGLVTAEQNRKATFYIYPKVNFNIINVSISIRGPYNTVGTASIPSPKPSPKKESLSDSETSKRTKKDLDAKSALPSPRKTLAKCITFDFGLFANTAGMKQEPPCEIPIKTYTEHNRVRISYIPRNTGIHQICLVSNGSHLQGSPYNVPVDENISGKVDDINEDEQFQAMRRRTPAQRRFRKARVISKIVDFVNEKLILKEDGSFASLSSAVPSADAAESRNFVQSGDKIKGALNEAIATPETSLGACNLSAEDIAWTESSLKVVGVEEQGANDLNSLGDVTKCKEVRFDDVAIVYDENDCGTRLSGLVQEEDDETMMVISISNGTTANDAENCSKSFEDFTRVQDLMEIEDAKELVHCSEECNKPDSKRIDFDQNCNYSLESIDENLNYTRKSTTTTTELPNVATNYDQKHDDYKTHVQNGIGSATILTEITEELPYPDMAMYKQNSQTIDIYKYFPEHISPTIQVQTQNFHLQTELSRALQIETDYRRPQENCIVENHLEAPDNTEMDNGTSYSSCDNRDDQAPPGEDTLDSYTSVAPDSNEEKSWESFEREANLKTPHRQQEEQTLDSASDFSESFQYSENESDASNSLNVHLNSHVIFQNSQRGKHANFADEFYVVPPLILTNAFTKEMLHRQRCSTYDNSGYESEEPPLLPLQTKNGPKPTLSSEESTSREDCCSRSVYSLINSFDTLSKSNSSTSLSYVDKDGDSIKPARLGDFVKVVSQRLFNGAPPKTETYQPDLVASDTKPKATRNIQKLITQFENKNPMSQATVKLSLTARARLKMETYSQKPMDAFVKSPDVIVCHSPIVARMASKSSNKFSSIGSRASNDEPSRFTYPICPEHIARNQVKGSLGSLRTDSANSDASSYCCDSSRDEDRVEASRMASATQRRRSRLQRSFATMSEDVSMDEEESISAYAISTAESDGPHSVFDVEERDDSFEDRDGGVDLRSIFQRRQQYWQKLSTRSLDSLCDNNATNKLRHRRSSKKSDNSLAEMDRSNSLEKFGDGLETSVNSEKESEDRVNDDEWQKCGSNLARRGSASLLNLLLERRNSSSSGKSASSDSDDGDEQDLHFQRESFKLMNIEERKAALFPRTGASRASTESLARKESVNGVTNGVTSAEAPRRLSFIRSAMPERNAEVSPRITINDDKCKSNCRVNNNGSDSTAPQHDHVEERGVEEVVTKSAVSAATTSVTGFSVKEMTLFFENSYSKPHQAISTAYTSTPKESHRRFFFEGCGRKLTLERTPESLTKATAPSPSYCSRSNNNTNNVNEITNQSTCRPAESHSSVLETQGEENSAATKREVEKGKQAKLTATTGPAETDAAALNETRRKFEAALNANSISSFPDALATENENEFDAATKKRFAKAKLFFQTLETVSMLSLDASTCSSAWSIYEDFYLGWEYGDCLKSHSFGGRRRRSGSRNHHPFRHLGGGKLGGSLRERYDIAGLFEDVVGDRCKNTSFKGIPNKNRVAQSLASFGRGATDEEVLSSTADEDGIVPDYDHFKKRFKSRRQRRSVFDVKFERSGYAKNYWSF